jgi:tetratricopeptide (TPR) repeat protein
MDKETGREAYFLLANLYYESQKFDKAEEALQMTLKIDPDFSEANNFLGYLYVEHNKNLDKAIELIQKALKAEPKNGAYLDSLGWAYYKKVQLEGRNDYLFKALQKLLEAVRYLEEPDIYEHIGDVQYSIGNWDEAVKSLEKAESLYTKMQDGEKQKEKVAVKLKNIKRLILMEKTDSKVIANHIEVGNGIQP